MESRFIWVVSVRQASSIAILLTGLLSIPLSAETMGDRLETFFTDSSVDSLRVCGFDSLVEAVVFTPIGGLEVVAAQDEKGDVCAEVYQSETYFGVLILDRSAHHVSWFSGDQILSYDMSDTVFAQGISDDHTPRSLAVSAFLHWEDAVSMNPQVGQESCTYTPNQCTFSPNHCSGISIASACDRHDWCYQCGYTQGKTRSDCDNTFFEEIYQLTGGNGSCASAYYWGVRLVGWLFWRDPNHPINRIHYGGDVYALGISMNGCEGTQYERMCTTYLY